MPLVFQQDINEHARLGLWKIEEDEVFFSTAKKNTKEISHSQKRKQHLAGRFLLKLLSPALDLENIFYADSGKPFLNQATSFFSISHTEGWVSAIVSNQKNVAVDLEIISDKALQIRNRFLAENEMHWVQAERSEASNLATLLWSAKESLYKYYGQAGVDFRQELQIKHVKQLHENSFLVSCLIHKQEGFPVDLIGRIENEYVLTYTA